MKENAGNAAPSRFIVTSNRGFAAYAQDELRALAPGSKFDELVEAETYVLRCPLPRNEALRRIAEQEPIFLRHLFPVDDAVPIAGGEKAIGRIVAAVAAMYSSAAEQARMAAIQIRKSDGFDGGFEPADLREAIGDKLKEAFAIETVVKQSDRIVSVYLSDDTAYIGISTASDNLSDWPGGAIRFRKEEGQASRAKFKLLEAEYTFGLDMSRYEQALDIGAAPGGWTSLLLERGAYVTAVDPGDLQPQLLANPKLTYLKKNAGDVQFKHETFDLLVCDMSWSPKQMVKLLIPLLDALRRGGEAIVTLKLMHGKPFQTVKDSVRAMQPAMQLVKAKQLFHNRDELTVYLRKSPY